jgi:hypothetical protein
MSKARAAIDMGATFELRTRLYGSARGRWHRRCVRDDSLPRLGPRLFLVF